MGRLLPVEAVPGPTFVDALRRAWDDGDAVLPVDPRLPAVAARSLVAALGGGRPVEDGDALVVATSGTTGEPKGAVLTHDAVRASAVATSARLDVDPGTDRWLSCLPLAHVGGLGVVLRALVTGTPLTFDVDEPATLVSLVATQLRRMDTTRFRSIVLGGAAPPEDRPPNCVITYGMTETGSGVVYDGRPLEGVEIRAVDGELQVRGPMLLRAYRDGVDPKDPDGWLATGDAGSVSDGVVRVEGRMGDVIVTGGEKVWPDPVERLLRRLPSVVEVAVAGRPDAEWGQRVVAWVVADGDPPSLDELRDAVKAELPAYAAPKQLVIVDDLPRTALGKVRRNDL
ncbi:MAG: menE [Acidimicrobiales bacterium]|nr:menE [Acidimicrobiales bacterium]